MIKNNIGIIKKFFKLVKGSSKDIVQLFVSSIFGHLTSLIFPVLAALIIKEITNQNYEIAFSAAIFLGIAYTVYNLCWVWNYKAYSNNFKYCFTTLQHKIINKVATYDEDFSLKISKGKILNTTNRDVVDLSMFVDTVAEYIIVSIKFIIIIGIFLTVNLYIGISVSLVMLLYIKLMDKNNKKISHYLEGQRKYTDKITDIFSQTLNGIREIKIFDIMPKLNNKFDIVKRKFEKQYMLKRKHYNIKNNIIPFLIDYSKIGLYLFLIYLVMKGRIELSTIILVISYYENIFIETKDLMSYSAEISDQNVAIKRINNILNYTSNNIIEFGDYDNDYIFGLVEFKNVSFSYKEQKTLKDISLKFRPNKITAIVGHTGSGKSTIVNLLMRLYKVDSGNIYIDGEDIYKYTKKVYKSNVSLVNQKPFVFNMSIYDNLALVDSNKMRIIETCKRVGIHDFIMTLPKGYRTVLKEDATDVSGGQKQLISLARTLLSGAEILIFDEVTSSLDPNTAKKIMNVLKDLKEDHTVIVITHKPEMMKVSDYIYVLNKGKIVGKGNHKGLIETNNFYKILQNKDIKTDQN